MARAKQKQKKQPKPIDPEAKVPSNTRIVAMLVREAERYDGGSGLSHFRAKASRNAALAIKKLSWPVEEVHGEKLCSAGEDPVKVKHIGKDCALAISKLLASA